MAGPIDVLLVEDSETFLRGLRTLFDGEADLHIVGTAHDGRTALELVQHASPTVAVLDLRIKWDASDARPTQENGLRCMRALRERLPHIGIVVLTGHSDPFWLRQVMAEGARAFLAKEEPPDRVLAVVRAVAYGQAVLSLEQLHWLQQAHNDPLTRRELDVLQLAAQGFEDMAIAEKLGIRPKTASKHLENIRGKLGVHNRTEAVAAAQQRGLLPPNSSSRLR